MSLFVLPTSSLHTPTRVQARILSRVRNSVVASASVPASGAYRAAFATSAPAPKSQSRSSAKAKNSAALAESEKDAMTLEEAARILKVGAS